ncbi:MAG TPA: hypothetical protein ENI99_00540 [Sedimenticola sp.]|nr:hypothetical protein [Sedimenticola sp.]
MAQTNDKKSARFERFAERCPECGGLGTITRYYGGGAFISTIDCDHCLGRGEIGNCATCAGTGVIRDKGGHTSAGPGECPDCRGAGAVGDCPGCGGTGVIQAGGGEDADCPECGGFGFV